MQLVSARTLFLPLILLATIFISGCEPAVEDKTKSLSPILSRAQTYVTQGQYKAAIIETKNALRISPQSIEAITLAARINLELGQSNSALQLLEPHIDSNDPRIRLLLAETYLSRGKFRSALNYLNLPYTPSPAITNQQKLTLHSINFKSSISLGNYSDSAQELKLVKALSSTDEENADYQYLKATLFFKQNRPKKVNAAIESALTFNNEHINALLMKSAIAYKQNNLEESEDTLTTALLALGDSDILLPKKVKILNALIDVLSSQGRSSEAYIYTKLLSKHNPKANEIKSKLKEAVELYTSGDYDQAEAVLLEINKNTPNARSRQLLGLLNIKKGNMADAESYLSEGFDPETANTKSISLLARTQLQLKQPQKVVAMLKEEVKARNNDSEILALYGLASLASNNEQEGIEALNQALQISPQKHRLRIALADYYESINKPSQALSHLEKAYSAFPDSIDIQQRLLKQYLRIEAPVNSTAFYSALKISPSDSRLNFLVGALQLKHGNQKQATAKLEKALLSDKTNIDALYALALTKLSDKKPKEAEKLFLQIIELSPENPQGYKGLSQSKAQLGEAKAIGPVMLKLNDKHPTSSGPSEVLSELHLRKKDLQEALKYAKIAYQRNPALLSSRNQILKIHNIQTQQYLANGKLDLARDQLIKALKILPNNLMFLSELINVEIKAGNVPEAKKLAGQVDMLAPKSALSLALNSDVAFSEGMPDVAMDFINQAWDLMKTDSIARKRFAILAHADQAKAESFLSEWIAALPKSAEPLRKKGTIELTNKHYESASVLFEKASKLNPKDAISLNNLAWLYQQQNDTRAKTVAKMAHDIAPNNAAIKDTYGWILSLNGEKAKAISLLSEASKLAPNDSEIKKHLEQAKQQ
ncbi:hypothetical protein A9Q81_11270 [Gammaproteobacteria bacterium 42_54_T18]|nr:hypothetical protein A9Q81_11270 [Gammaproteobacteria bacterium 42_54_T18]